MHTKIQENISLPKLAVIQQTSIQEINSLHSELEALVKTSLDKGIRIGELLSECKAQLKHGEFSAWVQVNCNFSQRIIKEWDGADWVKLFSILSGLHVDDIETSTDHKLETALYQSIQFVFAKFELEDLPVPDTLDLKPIWFKDCPLVPDSVTIPKNIGRLTIGQAIQARKLLEDVSDLREGISMVTAIYLQPLIDKGGFDILRAIEIEQVILKMPVTKIYPIGFFLLRRLNGYGRKRDNILLRMIRWIHPRRGAT